MKPMDKVSREQQDHVPHEPSITAVTPLHLATHAFEYVMLLMPQTGLKRVGHTHGESGHRHVSSQARGLRWLRLPSAEHTPDA